MRPLTCSLLQLLFLAGVTPAASALQQQPAEPGVVAGTVIAEGTLRPLPGVEVSAGAGHAAITDAAGRFRITGLAEGAVTLTTRLIGYLSQSRSVTAGDTRVNLTLVQAPIELNAVVVTGTAGGQQKRAIGNVVPTINASDVSAVAPVSDVQSLINGRAAGVEILPGSGQAGTGSKVRVRGISSLSLSNNPLLYVDGIRVDNNQSTGPNVQAFGSNVISRLNDYDLSDIQKIEIIEGPAAATLYGTEAASGVISIITKRGSVGAPSWELTAKQGSEWFMNPQGRFPVNYWMDTTGTVRTIDYKLQRAGAAERWSDLHERLHPGLLA
jgi:outer membrane receptor protein involved in Fe transport